MKLPPYMDSLLTDFGNERRMLALHGADILYDRQNKSWYIWNPEKGIWEVDTKGQIEEMAKDMIRLIKAEAEEMERSASKIDVSTDEGKDKKKMLDDTTKKLYVFAKQCQTPSRIEACLKLLQSSVAVSPDDFNKNPKLFNCLNGTLDLETGKLLSLIHI